LPQISAGVGIQAKRVSLFSRLQVPLLHAARSPLFLVCVLPRGFLSKQETDRSLVFMETKKSREFLSQFKTTFYYLFNADMKQRRTMV